MNVEERYQDALEAGRLAQARATRLADSAKASADELDSADLPDLAGLLTEIGTFIRRYVVMSGEQLAAVALWVAHTHAIEAADATPYLAITSAEKRSGKTRLLDVLELLVRNPWRVVRPSEAVFFRKIDKDVPSLLLDEADAIFKDRGMTYEGLRAALNAGHRRGTKIPRCVGEGTNLRVADFGVFCPKAIAGLGELPDTVADRAIPIRQRRRASHEHVERFRYREAEHEARKIRGKLASWAGKDLDALRWARPDIPAELNDRASEGWEPLLAVAEAAGDAWKRRALEAARKLQGSDVAEDPSLGVRLLADIRDVFEDRDIDRIFSADLAHALGAIDESPWGDSEHGRPLDQRALARRLKSYEIRSHKVRIGAEAKQGYTFEDFKDAWDRYVPRVPSPEGGGAARSTAHPERNTGTSQVGGTIWSPASDGLFRTKMPTEQGCSTVPFKVPEQGEQSGSEPSGDGFPRDATSSRPTAEQMIDRLPPESGIQVDLDASKAEVVELISNLRAQGLSGSDVAGLLNTQGTPPPPGFVRWTDYAVGTFMGERGGLA